MKFKIPCSNEQLKGLQFWKFSLFLKQINTSGTWLKTKITLSLILNPSIVNFNPFVFITILFQIGGSKLFNKIGWKFIRENWVLNLTVFHPNMMISKLIAIKKNNYMKS